jgi:aminoglycoside phosphotransferase (APT) family kinase protein
MTFVRQHTTIPVPKVYSAFEYKGRVYIIMQRIDGHMVGRNWYFRTEESKLRILSQLKSMVEQLRKLPAPDGVGVANVDGGPIFDGRLPKKSHWGPFRSISDFHSALVDGLDLNAASPDNFPELQELASFYNQPWPEPVFTHGDLSSLNILCRGDAIVALIDWETAGWLPPYWEYVSAWNVNPQNSFWHEEVDKFLTPLPYARDMDTIRRKYFGLF